MFWNKKKLESPLTPLTSQEFEKLSNLITTLHLEIKLLKGDLTGVLFDMEKLKDKIRQKSAKTPENTPEPGVFSGLPTTQSKSLNSFNPFL